MRWFSHRARTWKDTVLKIKIKKKAKGFTLVATALAVLCWIFIAQAFFMMSSGTLSTVKAERTAYQAEQNTALDVSRLKALDYDDLDSKGAHARKVIEGVGDGNWESEVTIDPEQPLNGGDDDAKLRIAHVKVYRTGDTTSRYSLDVPLTSQSGIPPVGTILAYVGDLNKIPTNWHLCDGTNGTPNLTGRFLEGTTVSIKQFKEAGLPNIKGDVGPIQFISAQLNHSGGAFYRIFDGRYGTSIGFEQKDYIYVVPGQGYFPLGFDASRFNSIYGRSDTVQPASYTVYYIMRIK